MKQLAPVQGLKRALTRNYEKFVRAVAKAARTSRDRAREALHQAICSMLSGLRQRPGGRRVLAWQPYVVRAGINALRDKLRESKRDVRFSELYEDEVERIGEIPDPGPRLGSRLEERETGAILWAEVKSLSPREAGVIKLWAHGVPFHDIGVRLKIAASTVRVLWMRGIRNLRNRPRVRGLAA